MKRIIAIVAGGDSSENPVSLRSAATVFEYMDKNLYEPYIVEIEGKKWQAHLPDGGRADIPTRPQGTWMNWQCLCWWACPVQTMQCPS